VPEVTFLIEDPHDGLDSLCAAHKQVFTLSVIQLQSLHLHSLSASQLEDPTYLPG
jgi:hypothetical protein